jgi:succinyl-CoA synthetase beta subunit
MELMDPSEQDPLELEANKYNLNYIRLNGNIGVMVNGAGLAMATMDLIKLYGGEPANFLDVGGGASVETIANGFRIILSDERVKAVLVNIFGGILRCDVLAEGLIQAARKVALQVPLIIRLEGTNVNRGRELLNQSGLDFIVSPTMAEAAKKVGQLVQGNC